MENNPFTPLVEMFPDRRGDIVVRLFDAGGIGDTPHQWLLSGLAMILHCLDLSDAGDTFADADLEVPILRELKAMQAAYALGVRDGARGLVRPGSLLAGK